QNLERLLEKAYKPEAPDADFAQRVRDRMANAAADRARSVPLRLPTVRRHVLCALAAAAAIAGLAFLLHLFTQPAPERPDPFAQHDDKGDQPAPRPVDPDAPEPLDAPGIIDRAPVPQQITQL